MKNKNGIFYVVISLIAIIGLVGVVSANVSFKQLLADSVAKIIAPKISEDFINEDVNIGAFPGPDVYADVNIHGSFTFGSGNVATTTDTAAALLGKDLIPYRYIEVLNGSDTSDVTYTLPATSTMISILPNIGSTREWIFHNATTSDESELLIFAAGAGMDLVTASSSQSLTVGKGDYAKLLCTRISYVDADNENIMCEVIRLFNAD